MSLTETVVTGLLREKHRGKGNGGNGEWAFFSQVRNAAGFEANRTFDAVAIHLWPSRGLPIHVFEIKVSRSDWLSELKKPAKAEDACKVADHFTIVAPKGCVRDGELPDEWGLIEIGGEGTDDKPWKLRTVRAAPKLHDERTKTKHVDRGFLVGLLRSAPGVVVGGPVPQVHRDDLRREYQRGYEDAQRESAAVTRREDRRWEEMQREVTGLVDALRAEGVPHYQAQLSALRRNASLIAAAISRRDVKLQLDSVANALRTALGKIEEMDS